MSSKPSSRRRSAGFTLPELLAAVAVSSILLVGVTSFYLAEQRSLGRVTTIARTEQEIRIALDQIVRELRVVGRNPAGASGIGVLYAGANELRFSLDRDGDGSATGDELRGFRRSGTTIQIYAAGAVAPWETFAEPVASTGALFRYYRADGSEVTTLPADTAAVLQTIRRIDVTVGYSGRAQGGPFARTQTASVWLRNAG